MSEESLERRMRGWRNSLRKCAAKCIARPANPDATIGERR